MEFHNPGYELKPGMYATIEINSHLADRATLVPDMAVIDTGLRQVAYVMREPGKFEPRELKIGVRAGANELQVLSGLKPGEKVVVSGQFLIDSEASLRESSLKMLQAGKAETQKIFTSDGWTSPTGAMKMNTPTTGTGQMNMNMPGMD
jgi:multidrug efflux pump subunit AcrA (membrane-fusion protein)